MAAEMDYGVLKLDTGDQIHLYGAPEKEKLKLVHATLNKDCIGLILLINNEDTDPVGTMFQHMDAHCPLVEKWPRCWTH